MTWDDAWEPTPELVSEVLKVVGTIPPGRVMTYGDVAEAIGPHGGLGDVAGPFAARMVGRVMQHFGGEAPWWRVIRSTGHPPGSSKSAPGRITSKSGRPCSVRKTTTGST